MSTTIIPSVVIGYEVLIYSVSEEVTRYDEINGKPYQKDKRSHYDMACDGVLIASSECFSSSEFIEGLKIFSDGSYAEDGERYSRVLGYRLTDDFYNQRVTTSFDADFVPREIAEFSDKFNLKPSHFLICYIS